MPLLTDQRQVAEVAERIARHGANDRIALDTETSGFLVDTGDELRGISYDLADGSSGYLPVSHGDHALDPTPVIRALNYSDARQVFHNAQFDWAFLSAHAGFEPAYGRTDDTMVASWLAQENGTHALKGLGALYFGDDAKAEQTALKKLMAGRKKAEIYRELRDEGMAVDDAKAESALLAAASKRTWATFTAADIAEYAEQDAVITNKLWARLGQGHYEPTDPWEDYPRELRVQEAVYRMTRLGVAVDLEMVERQRANNLRIMGEIEPQFEGVNLRSPKQLVELIYGKWGVPVGHRTKKGNPSTAREALEEIQHVHEGVASIIEYRKRSKAVGTYYDAMLAKADRDGRIHTNLNVAGTVTGRFSSSAPNLQNIPRDDTDPEVKQVFIAAPGYELWEYDLKSAELFVGAAIAHDDDMLGALSDEGRDFHTETAMRIFGSIEGNRRTLAKNMNYGIPYGIGPSKFAVYIVKGTGRPVGPSDVRQAKKLISLHREAWPLTHRAIARLTNFAKKNHYLPLAQPGRYRHFRGPNIWVKEYTAFNAAVQGGVAEHMKNVMLEAEYELALLGARMVLQVHDSLWVEQPPGTEAKVLAILQRISDEVNVYTLTRLVFDSKRRYPKEKDESAA